MQFTVPTEFFKGPEDAPKEDNKENEQESSGEESVVIDSTENIEKTEQLEEPQFETKNHNIPNPVEVKNEEFIFKS